MKSYLISIAQKYRKELRDNILPFWIDNGIDKVNGGIYTALDRGGVLMDSDKSVWFQGRAAWVFSYCYNTLDRNPQYLAAAKSCVDFIEKHCFDADGRMFYQVTAAGVPVRKRRYAFSETFAAIAFAEYSIASGEQSYAEKALELFDKILYYIGTPGLLEPKFREGFSAKGHSICMILIDTAHCIQRAVKSEKLQAQINRSVEEIRRDFMHPEFKAVLETVAPDGSFIDSMAGRTINPGHSLETGWFILEEAKYSNWNAELIETGKTIIDWSWDWGWDKQYGGILYFRDCKNRPQQEYWQDMKFWWPQNEAALAMLYAALATGDVAYIEKFKMVDEYMFSRLKDAEFPEWYGYLHYDGSVAQPAKGNMYKGPFHIPRMLIRGAELCEELAEIFE
ncbi:N-acylglucosamine 2-epimerase [Mucinivorans hirudinis]|uniref:N-acylglucosamine 2-epimerase n=1 Tax=Mucinivorans hirudinis TaxID=1433126 RepID=A0A060R9Y2_9BACT|nr:N-acylglucosamine 2-epimerase [Mucinivorans hirudinis]